MPNSSDSQAHVHRALARPVRQGFGNSDLALQSATGHRSQVARGVISRPATYGLPPGDCKMAKKFDQRHSTCACSEDFGHRRTELQRPAARLRRGEAGR